MKANKPPRARLRCTGFLLDEQLKDLIIDLRDSEITVGRDPANTVCIKSKKISRNHARIYYDGEHWVIEDLNSTNGIHVNGIKQTSALLLENTLVSIGGIEFRYSVQIETTILRQDFVAPPTDDSFDLEETILATNIHELKGLSEQLNTGDITGNKAKTGLNSLFKSKITLLIGLIILIVGVAAGVFLYS